MIISQGENENSESKDLESPELALGFVTSGNGTKEGSPKMKPTLSNVNRHKSSVFPPPNITMEEDLFL